MRFVQLFCPTFCCGMKKRRLPTFRSAQASNVKTDPGGNRSLPAGCGLRRLVPRNREKTSKSPQSIFWSFWAPMSVNERDRCEACAPLLIRPRTLSDTSFVLSWERDNLRWYRSALVWARAFPGRELVRRPVEVSSTVHGGGGVLMRRKKWSANDGDCEMDCSHLDATCIKHGHDTSIERTSAMGRARHGHVKEIVARLHV